MKIIHITGYANTGKTTFITSLIGELEKKGTVGVIKHLPHHAYTLEPGKDTTLYYEHGAAWSVGIDGEKAVAAIRTPDLMPTLALLADAGIEYAVIEGFKQYPFPKAVFGDLDAEGCILRDPGTREVIEALDRFEDFHTMQGLVKELKREHDVSRAGAILTFNGIVREWTGDTQTEYLDFDKDIDGKLAGIKAEMVQVEGILGVRCFHHKGRLYARDDITYIAVMAEHRFEAFEAVSAAIDRLKRELHDVGKELKGAPEA